MRSLLQRISTFWHAETWLLVSFFLAATLLLTFGLIADEVMGGSTTVLDQTIILLFRSGSDSLSGPIGPPWVREMARDITSLGSVAVLGIVSFVVVRSCSKSVHRKLSLWPRRLFSDHVYDPGRPAGPNDCIPPPSILLRGSGYYAYVYDRRQPRISRCPLSHRRSGWLVRRLGVGSDLLGHHDAPSAQGPDRASARQLNSRPVFVSFRNIQGVPLLDVAAEFCEATP